MLDSVAATSSKFASRFKRDRGPPPVPEKDVYPPRLPPTTPYASSSFSMSSASFSSSFMQTATADSSTNGRAPSSPGRGLTSSRSMKSFRRAIAKIPNVKIPPLPKRPSFASSSSSTTPQQVESDSDHGDADISLPWNISHDLHVEPREDGLAGLPSSWSSALAKAGFSENEIHAMYAQQRRLPSFSSSPPTGPGALPPRPWNRTVQSLPRSVSPSSGTRPYSTYSSAKSTFTYASSEFPSELGSIRIGRDMYDGSAEYASQPSVSSHPPKQNVQIATSTPPPGSQSSPVLSAPTTPIHRPYVDSPSSLSSSMPPEHRESNYSDNDDSDENSDDESVDQVSADLLSPTTPTTRMPTLPPRLTLSAEAVEEDDWTQSLLSSLGTGSFHPFNDSQSVYLPPAQADAPLPSPLSDHRRDTIVAPLRTNPMNASIPTASSIATPNPHLSSSTTAPTTHRTSSSIRSASDASSSASSVSSHASISSMHDAAIATTQLLRRVSVSHAIALKGSRPQLKLRSETSAPASSASVPQIIQVKLESDSSSPDMSIKMLTQDSSNDATKLSPDPLPPTPIYALKNSPSLDEFSDEFSPSPSSPTSVESGEIGPENASDVYAENAYLDGDSEPGSAQILYPGDRSSSLRVHNRQSPASDKPQLKGPSSSQGLLPSPSLRQYTGAGSIRSDSVRPSSPLGTQSYDAIPTGPQTPNRSGSLRPAHLEEYPVSPLDKALPPVPPSDASRSMVADDGNSLLPEMQFPRDTESNTQRIVGDSDVERLFGPLIPYLSVADPLKRFSELTQVAEGQFGPVFAARAIDVNAAQSSPSAKFGSLVAVKMIRVEEEGSPKVEALAVELEVMSQVRHVHILATAGLFVRGDTLWVEMELMERSLADMLPLVEDGLVIAEPEVARFASDVLSGLAYLEELSIAHRDVRSDNLLLSRTGVLKLADFSHAVVTQRGDLCTSVVPVPPYWMAPEMRLARPYNPHLVDVWSVGATVWEIIEGSPPFLNIEDSSEFGERWPPLKRASDFSVSLHQFLRLCSEMDDWRPHPDELLGTPFIRGACPRNDIVTLLAEVRLLEDGLADQ